MNKRINDQSPVFRSDDNNLKTYGSSYLKWKNWDNSSILSRLSNNQKAYYSAEINKTKKTFDEQTNVLEIGFGKGSFLRYAAEKKWNIHGTEMNEKLVERMADLGYAVHGDSLIEFKDNTFDLVVAFDVLEHIPQHKLPNFIVDVKRILKKGGFFLA